MFGNTDNTYGSPGRLWGSTQDTSTDHFVVYLTDTPSTISENVGRTPIGGIQGVATHIGRMWGKVFNPRVTQG